MADYTEKDLEKARKLLAQVEQFEQGPYDEKSSVLIATALAAARKEEREACAKLAETACLVPPDGGSPTEAERMVGEAAAAAIRARSLKPSTKETGNG